LGLGAIVILLFLAMDARGAAQGTPTLKRPEQGPEEKLPEAKKQKKVKGPRAVGILQFSNSGKATLVPVAILIDGKFYDASAYKADPVPMALDVGTVYEAEQAGESQGLFTVNAALHSKAANTQRPWVGTGSYLPQGTEAPKATRKAENVPVGLDNSGDEPPRLTRRSAAGPADSKAEAGGSGGGGTEDKGKPASAPTSEKAPEGQTAPVQGSPSQNAPAQSAPNQSTPSQTTPSQAPASQAGSGQSGAGKSSEDYYRPTLRRGKPTAPAPQEEDDTAVKTGKGETGGAASGGNTVRLIAAISDGGGPEPQSYRFFWKTGEEEDRRKQMLALAADEVRAYVGALARNRILAHPPAVKAGAGHKGKPAELVFENVQFHGFDVWLNSQPVMILSAEAHLPAAPGADSAPEIYSVTLVARTDIYGSLRKLYSGVTDKFHLDITPRLELVDVVDADGDRRGEFLFRETTDAGEGYVIYRPTPDKLWKMFDGLNAE
jgi:hypothetical protein